MSLAASEVCAPLHMLNKCCEWKTRMILASFLAAACKFRGRAAGEWVRSEVPAHAQAQMPVFAKPEGIILMQLNSSASGHDGVHDIQVRCSPFVHAAT